MRKVLHLGDGRWWDADAHRWRSGHGKIIAVRGTGLADVRSTYVVLACAHLDHDPGNNDPANLAALCQRCHMLHDAAEHRWQRWWNVFRLCAIRDLFEEPPLVQLKRSDDMLHKWGGDKTPRLPRQTLSEAARQYL